MFPSPFDRSASPALPPHPPSSSKPYRSHPPPQNAAAHPKKDRKTRPQTHRDRDRHEFPAQIQTSAPGDNTAAAAAKSAPPNYAARSTAIETHGSAPPDPPPCSAARSNRFDRRSNSRC